MSRHRASLRRYAAFSIAVHRVPGKGGVGNSMFGPAALMRVVIDLEGVDIEFKLARYPRWVPCLAAGSRFRIAVSEAWACLGRVASDLRGKTCSRRYDG